MRHKTKLIETRSKEEIMPLKKRRDQMSEEQGLLPLIAEADDHDVDGKRPTRKQRFKPYDQYQTYLLPARLDDFVGRYHIARLVSMCIDLIDISNTIEGYKGGASAYDPRMLLKVWVLGYLYKIYTVRPLERALKENVIFMWISGNQQPDFRTLNNFRRRLRSEIKDIFRSLVRMLVERGIVEGKDVFIDNTKYSADANRHKVVWRKTVEQQLGSIEEELDRLCERIEKIQSQEEQDERRMRVQEDKIAKALEVEQLDEMVAQINRQIKAKKIDRQEGNKRKADLRRAKTLVERKQVYEHKKEKLGDRNSYATTDTDATVMYMKDETLQPGYNEGISVDNGFVVGYVISQSSADNVSFKELMEETKDAMGKAPETVTADGAFGNEENYKYLEDEGITGYVKYTGYYQEKTKKYQQQRIRIESFVYDGQTDTYRCPQGKILVFSKEKIETTKTGYKQTVRIYKAADQDCAQCCVKTWCTEGKSRILSINQNYLRLKEKAKAHLSTEAGREHSRYRAHMTESVFGDRKHNHRFRRFHLRGIEGVLVESGLYYCMHNIKRLYTLILESMYKPPTSLLFLLSENG